MKHLIAALLFTQLGVYAGAGEIIPSTQETKIDFPNSAAPYKDHEDGLLDSDFGFAGKGKFIHYPKLVRDTGDLISAKAIWDNAVPMVAGWIDFDSIYKKAFLPEIQKDFPELIAAYENPSKNPTAKEKAYNFLYDKILDEGGKNWFFVKLSATMHRSSVPDLANLYFGLSHPIYDVLFDNAEISDFKDDERINRLSRLVQRDYSIENPSAMESLLIKIVKGLEASIPSQNVEPFFYYLLKLHEAQVDSIRQHLPISPKELRRTTFRKGGYSMVLYALLADHDFSQDEIDAYFLEGAMLQNLDDFSDIAEDKKEGISTLAMRKLITPNEVWQMKDRLHQRFLKFVPSGAYDESAIDNYIDALDKFISMNTKLYDKAIGKK